MAGLRRAARVAWFALPVVVWLAVITLASTNLGSSAHTGSVLERLMNGLFGWKTGPSHESFSVLSVAVRKTAHVVEYLVLALLLCRALWGLARGYVTAGRGAGLAGRGGGRRAGGSGVRRAGGRGILWRLALVVVPFGAVVAASDEFHQAFVASRAASPIDALIDVAGVLAGLAVVWLILRGRAAG